MDNLPVASINDYPAEKFNRLFPATLTQISPLHKVMVNIVSIDPIPEHGEVYKQTSGNGLSLTKIACLKLMTAANVIMEDSKPILPKACQRCTEIAKMTRLAPQCGTCETKKDVAYQVSILVPEPSGGHRRYIATKEIALEDYLVKKGAQEHMAAQCETKALLRALRAGLGIKGAYSAQELNKPFAVALVVLNTTDPDLKQALIQRYAAGHDALFGGTPQLPIVETPMLNGDIDTEVIVDDEVPYEELQDEQLDEGGSRDLDDTPPWMTKDIVTCNGCDEIIESSGSWTADRIISYSKSKYGKILCPKCQKAGGQR
jgi:RNA polymerase subunit RPABC4/transcription elongation factor Spt4